MNKIIFNLLIIAPLIVNMDSFAQDSKFGIRAGVNVVSFGGANSKYFSDDNTGYTAGFYYDYVFTDKIGAETSFLYSSTGSANDNDTNSISIGYFDVPILFKYYLHRHVNLQAGPQISIFANSSDANGFEEIDLFKTIRTSAVFGAEFKTDFNLSLSVKYLLGLNSIIAPQTVYTLQGDEETNFDVKYNALQIGIGYLFK